MKPILNQNIINKYILDEFGEVPNPSSKDEMIYLINNHKLTLERVKLWVLFDGDLMIKGYNGNTILHSTSYKGQLDIIEYVLDKGVDVDYLNNYNEIPLLFASCKSQIEVINLLLERGSNINHQSKCGWSALHVACNCNELEVVKVLIERGIDIHLKGNYYNKNETALDIAKSKGYSKIINYLTPLFI